MGEMKEKSSLLTHTHSISAKALLDRKVTELKTVIEPILPKVGVVAFAGESDSGKSSFLRMLSIAIVKGEKKFLGWTIHAEHRRVIYVSSEDDEDAISHLLHKQTGGSEKNDEFENLRFIFETHRLLGKLEEELKIAPVDLVVVDAFADIYPGDLNSSNQIRFFINKFSNLAKKYRCLIIFLHHTGKRTQKLTPSKDNLLGSQGFEAKMRMVVELRKDPENDKFRHLCIVKGNYLPGEYKTQSFKLEFLRDLNFINLNERVDFDELGKSYGSRKVNDEVKNEAIKLKQQGYSINTIKKKLDQEGKKPGRSTIGEWVKDVEKKSKAKSGNT